MHPLLLPEILLILIRHIPSQHDRFSCAAVCQAWHEAFTPHNWESVSLLSFLNDPIKAVPAIHLLGMQRNACHIRQLSISAVELVQQPGIMDFAVQCQHLTRLVLVSSRYLTPTNGLELLTSNVWDTYFARIIENNQRTLQAVDMYLEDFDEPPGIPFWETLAGCDSLRTLVCEDLDLLSTSSNLYHLQSQDNATDNPWHPVHGQSWRAVRRILNRVETLSLQDSRFPTRPEWWQPLVDEGQHQGDQFHDQEHNRVQQPAKSLVFSRLKEVWIHGGHLTGLELLLQCVATSVTMPVCDDVSGREEDGKEFAFCQLQHLTWSCISGRLEEDYPKVEHFLQVFSQTNMRIQLLQAQCPSSEVFWRVRSLLEESNDVGTSDTSKLRKGVKLRDVNLNSILTRLRETPMRSIELGQAA